MSWENVRCPDDGTVMDRRRSWLDDGRIHMEVVCPLCDRTDEITEP